MKRNPLNLIIGVILAVLVVSFLWFQVRPSYVRSKCAVTKYSIDRYIATVGKDNIPQVSMDTLNVARSQGLPTEAKNSMYRRCLISFGLKAEDLY